MRTIGALLSAIILASCGEPAENRVDAAPSVSNPDTPQTQLAIRLTGIVEAVHSTRVVVPRLSGSGGRLTLTSLIPNGTVVEAGDLVAEFDAIAQMDSAREAAARFEDLTHQVRTPVLKTSPTRYGRRRPIIVPAPNNAARRFDRPKPTSPKRCWKSAKRQFWVKLRESRIRSGQNAPASKSRVSKGPTSITTRLMPPSYVSSSCKRIGSRWRLNVPRPTWKS